MCQQSKAPFRHSAEHTGCRVKHGVCPLDGSGTRHRFMCAYWHTEMLLPDGRQKGLRVLHIAPEKSILLGLGLAGSDRVAKYVVGDYMVDPMATVPASLHGAVTPHRGLDIQDTRYPDAHFDVVICSRVLEHVMDDGKAMRELLRVMRFGGVGLISAPWNVTRSATDEDGSISPSEAAVRFGQTDHKRVYGNDLPSRMQAAGFDVTVINTCEWFARRAATAQLWSHVLNPEVRGRACEMHTIVRRPKHGATPRVEWGNYTLRTPLTYVRDTTCRRRGHWGEVPVFDAGD